MKQNGQFILMNQDEFKTWLFTQKFNRVIRVIQEHNTAGPVYADFNSKNHFELAEDMKNYHVNTMHWQDIAQNITIFPDGLIMICRPFNIAPAGIYGCNISGLCIENLGSFDIGKDVMTTNQKLSIVFVTAALCKRFNLAPSIDTITYHCWWDLDTGMRVLDNRSGHNTKTCPGTNFFGGNSTISAKNNFYPAVSKAIYDLEHHQSPLTPFQQAIERLIIKKDIANPDYWLQHAVPGNTVNGTYAGILLMHAMGATTLTAAVQQLAANKIINYPEDWLAKAVPGGIVDGAYMQAVIINLGKIL